MTVKEVTEKSTPTPGVTRRVIHIQKKKASSDEPAAEERFIEHYQMLSWADNTAIEENSEPFAALNHLLNKVFVSKKEKPGCPVLVHCSAGIGRTGTFLALCLMIEAIKELQKLKKESIGEDDATNSGRNNNEPPLQGFSEEIKDFEAADD